jgi:SAM-dependent methyltransferase
VNLLYGRISSSEFYKKLILYANRSSYTFPLLFLRLIQISINRKERNVSITRGYCPLCNSIATFIRFYDNEWGINCIKCLATPPIMSFIGVLKEVVGNDLRQKRVFEMSSSGPLYRYLLQNSGSLYCSEFFEDVRPGSFKFGAQCQDVQELTFKNNAFDLVTCTEVFEHVPNDLKGFSEILRTLKPGGFIVFMVPLYEKPTVERAVYANGKIIHRLDPEYHFDPLKSEGCLCFRNYGPDIVDRLKTCGFKHTRIIQGNDYTGWGYRRYVVAARKEL